MNSWWFTVIEAFDTAKWAVTGCMIVQEKDNTSQLKSIKSSQGRKHKS